MNSRISLNLSSSLSILSGLILIMLRNQPHDQLKYMLIACLMLSAFFSLLTAFKNSKFPVRILYHETHAVSMIAYCGVLFFFCDSLTTLIGITTLYFLFYFFLEIIFNSIIFNLDKEINLTILGSRILIAIAVGIGSVVVYSSKNITEFQQLVGLGLLMILVGVNGLFYKPITKPNEMIS